MGKKKRLTIRVMRSYRLNLVIVRVNFVWGSFGGQSSSHIVAHLPPIPPPLHFVSRKHGNLKMNYGMVILTTPSFRSESCFNRYKMGRKARIRHLVQLNLPISLSTTIKVSEITIIQEFFTSKARGEKIIIEIKIRARF